MNLKNKNGTIFFDDLLNLPLTIDFDFKFNDIDALVIAVFSENKILKVPDNETDE